MQSSAVQKDAEEPETPLALYQIPHQWSYTSLVDHPAQDVTPSLLGIFDHRDIPSFVIKLHKLKSGPASESFDHFVKEKLKPGQSSTVVEEGALSVGFPFVLRQISYEKNPKLLLLLSVKVGGKGFFFEVEAGKKAFEISRSEVFELANELHSE